MIQAIDPTHPSSRSAPRRAVLAAVVISGLLAAGCGSDNGSDAAPTATTASGDDSTSTTATADTAEPSGDGCDIVSDEVVAEVLGVEIVRREATGDPGSASVSCLKGTERADDPADFFYVSVGIVAGGTALVDQSSAEQGSQTVDGLGDQAVYLPSAGALFIADGTDLVQVQVVQAGVPGSQEDCVTVANDVLDRRS